MSILVASHPVSSPNEWEKGLEIELVDKWKERNKEGLGKNVNENAETEEILWCPFPHLLQAQHANTPTLPSMRYPDK